MPSERVTKLLEDIRFLDEGRHALVQELRGMILGVGSSVSEEVKYGGLLFSSDKPFCGVFSYTNHVSLEFSSGALLPDLHQVLEGSGTYRRHIKLSSIQDIGEKHVQAYIALAHDMAIPE